MKTRSLCACLLVAAAFTLIGCNGNKASGVQENVPIPVVAKPIERINVAKDIAASGNIEGCKTVKLGFMVAGKVNYVTANEGKIIAAGQLLASLDPENYKIAKDMADANLDQAQDEYNRLQIMHDRKSISESDFSKISNTLKLARAQQRLQNKNISDTRLYSPISGVLLKKGVEMGEIISAGLPLFAVSDISFVHVIAAIPEADLNQMKIGNNATVYITAINATVQGRIIEVGSVAEPTTRTFTVKIELNNPRLNIRPGMTAEIKIPSGQKTEIVAVQGEAVLRNLDNTAYVFIADQTKKQAFKRTISIGRMAGNNIEVTSGLAPGEWVIVGGQHKLNNGSFITLK